MHILDGNSVLPILAPTSVTLQRMFCDRFLYLFAYFIRHQFCLFSIKIAVFGYEDVNYFMKEV
jgi:hypothetical protein